MKTERFWGADKDAHAATQLGLGLEYTIFMMGSEVDYIDDEAVQKIEDQFTEQGYTPAEEVVSAIQDSVLRVTLPKGCALVGMQPVGKEEPRVYAVVDFTSFGRAE